MLSLTSVSETIRKPPLVKAQTALRKQTNKIRRKKMFSMAWNSYTLQCGRWLWDDMPLNSPKRPPYLNSTSGFHFDHITAVDMSLCTSLRNLIQIGPPSAEKMTSCRFSRWRISAILDFRGLIMGSLKSPCMISYRSSIETIAPIFLRKSRFCILATDRRTDRQARCMKPLSLSRAAA